MPSETSGLQNEVFKYLLKTPKALAFVFFSFISGYIWLYLILVWLKGSTNNKATRHLDSGYAKTALGLLWFAIVMYPLYCIKFGFGTVELEKVYLLAWNTLLTGLFFQGIITIIIIRFLKP